jgi:hypothetical protein
MTTLSNLPEEQSNALEQWLFDDTPTLSYAQAGERLEREFGVKASYGALASFFQRCSQKRLTAKIASNAETIQAVGKQVGQPSLEVFDTLMELGGFAVLESSFRSGNASPDQIKDTLNLAALGLRVRNNARLTRVRERAQALRERSHQLEVDRENRQIAREERHNVLFNPSKNPSQPVPPNPAP